MSTKKSSSKKQLQSKNITKQTKTIKMRSQRNKYYIIENQFLDISLLKNKEVPNDYINFLKKCYKINNTIFPYDIIDNKLPQHLDVSLLLLNYICSNGKLYLKDYKGRKQNYLTTIQQPYLEDNYDDNRYAIDILYFHNVPEEIGKLEIIIPILKKRTKKWKQQLFGHEITYIKHIIKSGTVVIINSYKSYEFTIETKLKTEYVLPIVKFTGSTEYPINTDYINN
jgi:hypothetical protein